MEAMKTLFSLPRKREEENMRIMMLVHSLSMGGAERVTANLANYWAAKGWQVAVATLTSAESDFYALDPRVKRIPLNVAARSPNVFAAVSNNLRSLRAVRRLLKEWRPDVAIGMMTASNVYLALAAKGLPVRCIGSERVHPPRLPLGRVWERLRSISYGRLDAVVTLTERSAEWVKAHTSARSVVVIPNPIPWPLPFQEPIRDPAEVMREGRQICLAVGRLTRQKGFDLLIRAFSEIAPKFPAWDLVIVGEGELREDLEHQVQELGLQERVHLAGRVGNMGDWYKAADLYVMSSRFEGFPNTLVEALACGLPAISFDCETGPSDIIRHGIDGLLVPDGDVVALKTGLERLMADEGLRQRLALRATEARERFSLDRIGVLWERLFCEIMS